MNAKGVVHRVSVYLRRRRIDPKERCILVTGPLLCGKSYSVNEALARVQPKVLFNVLPSQIPLDADQIVLVIDDYSLLNNQKLKRLLGSMRVVIMHYDRRAPKIKTLIRAKGVIELKMRKRVEKGYQRSIFDVTKACYQGTESKSELLRLVSKSEPYLLEYMIQENIPRLTNDIDDAHDALDTASLADTCNYKLPSQTSHFLGIVGPPQAIPRRKRKRYPRMRFPKGPGENSRKRKKNWLESFKRST